MDFLGEYNAKIDCRGKKVVFKPEGGDKFLFVGGSSEDTQDFLIFPRG